MQITQDTLTWFFKDPEWKNKFLVGSALMFAATAIPFIGWLGIFVVYGYCLILMRATLRGEAPALPKWDDFGELFVDGLKAGLAAVGFWVPPVLIFTCAFAAWFGFIFSTALASRGASNSFPAAFPFVFVIYFFALMLANVFFYIAFAIAPVSIPQYLRTGKIGAGYRLREMIRIVRANLGAYFLTWALFLGLQILAGVATVLAYVTIIGCFLIPFIFAPIHFYLNLMWATLFGAAYREAVKKIPELESSN